MASVGDLTVPRNQQCYMCLNRLRSPRVLPCLHAFCLACLEWVVQSTRSGSTFPCPTCRCKTHIPRGGVKQLQVYVEASNGNLQISLVGNAVMCSICGLQTATSKCVECDQFACNSCDTAHSKIVSSRYHTVIRMNGVSSATPLVVTERFCATHQDEKVRFYCTVCHCLICRDCKMAKHEGHPAVDISEMSNEAKNKVLDVVAKCGMLGQQLERSLREAQRHHDDLAKKETEILSTFRQRADEIRRTVDSCLKQAETNLTSQSGRLKHDVSKAMEEMQQQIGCLYNLCQHVDQVVKTGRGSDIMSLPEVMAACFGCVSQRQGHNQTSQFAFQGQEMTELQVFGSDNWLQKVQIADVPSTSFDDYRDSSQYINQNRGDLMELITEKIGKITVLTSTDPQCRDSRSLLQSQYELICQAVEDIRGTIGRWYIPGQATYGNAVPQGAQRLAFQVQSAVCKLRLDDEEEPGYQFTPVFNYRG